MRSSFISANGLRIHCLAWEAGSGARPVLLLHGLASNARIWELVAPRLVEAGLGLIAPDLRGHGLSDKPDAGYDFESISSDVAALLDSLGWPTPIVVGHSWGGALALSYAARFPTGRGAPAGLVLIDGGITQLDDFPGASWEIIREILAPPRLAGIRLADFLARMNDPARKWRPDDRQLDIILGNFEVASDGRISPRMTFERHMLVVRALWELKTYERFQEVQCPVLMLPARPPRPWSPEEEGHMCLKERGIERARQTIADLQVRWMEDTIHDIPLQKPQALAEEILAFAKELDA